MLSTRGIERKNHINIAKSGKWFTRLFVFFLITLGFGSGVVAGEYLGPDRTYQVTTYETCDYGVWAKSGGGCFDASGNPRDCTICGWDCNPGSACGDADYWYKLGT